MKRAFAIVVAALTAVALFAGCGDGGPQNEPQQMRVPTEDGGVTYADFYYPIVATPITLSASIQNNNAEATSTLWKELEELTGISFDVRAINATSAESVKLLYISRDYPDISFRLQYGDALTREAIAAGDVLEITGEMLEKYAPNWSAVFDKHPEVYEYLMHTDGKIYSLPTFQMSEEYIALRDAWMINGDWLDELGMNIPKTLDDFTAYLRAVKNAAGTGTIPSNVIPLYIRDNSQTENIGAWYTIADTFGLYNGLYSEIVEDGVVKSNANNLLLKDVVKYLNQLYVEKLINADFSKVTWSAYQAEVDYYNTSTDPWHIGSFFNFNNRGKDFMIYMEPVTTSSGLAPVMRPTGVASRFLRFGFVIFAGNKYPAASLRLGDIFGSKEGAVRVFYGEKGYGWDDDGQGGYIKLEPEKVIPEKSGTDYFAGLIDSDIVLELNREEAKDPNSRLYLFFNIYKKYIPDTAHLDIYPRYALDFLTETEQARVSTVTTAYNSLRRQYFQRWVSGTASVDDEWDSFQKKLEDIGYKELLQLKQKAYDMYKAAAK